MSAKLLQSLDAIIGDKKNDTRATRAGRRAPVKARKPATTARVAKNTATKGTKTGGKIPTGPAAGASKAVAGSKISVSNLPLDIPEHQIKDFFQSSIGPVRKAVLSYGPDGNSRGIAQVSFVKPGDAARALAMFNNTKVDNRPMKIELIVDATQAPATAQSKSLSERITKPKTANKDKPKPATASKTTTGKGRKAGRGAKSGSGRGKPKSAEELDAEMEGYFAGGNGGNDANGVQAANGDTAMEDEVM